MGTVVFVGAGAGAADLITVRGLRWLQRADIVLTDALVDPALRDHAPQARWIDVGKRGFCHTTAQANINAMLLQLADQHAVVVRLKGGDPSVFGRLEEELAAVRAAGHTTEVVPGITAALAAAADLQRPLTRRGRGRSVALTTAMTREGALSVGCHADTEVFYMAGKQLPALAKRLLEAGWHPDTPVLAISRAGWPDARSSQHTVQTLANASAQHSGQPTVVIVGAGTDPVGPTIGGHDPVLGCRVKPHPTA